MLNSQKVLNRAAEIFGSQLSPQASAVAASIVEAINEAIIEKRRLSLGKQAVTQEDSVRHTPSNRMKKPTLDEVKAHGLKIELPESECSKFFSYYESNGWRVGRVPMKLWTAAMANWKRIWQDRTVSENGHSSSSKIIASEHALRRVEARVAVIRGQCPLPSGHALLVELATLREEKKRLLKVLDWKA